MREPGKLRPDGFRERGGEVTRIEAFVDAAFAFAVTMLVISVGAIPDSIPKLIVALKGTPAFAASFAQIALFWYAHMTWSRRYGLDDRGSVVLSLVLVFLVLLYIYPLKYMFAGFFTWISHGWLSPDVVIRTMDELRAMFAIYGVVFCSMAIVLGLLYRQAWKHRDEIGLSLDEQVATVQHIAEAGVTASVALLSIAVAFALPERPPQWMTGAPGMVYALMGFNGLVPVRIARRARARLLARGVA